MQILSKHELWVLHAPDFNFELDEDELLAEAINRGFVVKVGEDQYAVNEQY